MDDDEYLNSLMEQATVPEYEYGELSTVFPSFVGEEEFTRLVEDIRENGLIDPIVVWNNEIVDGRHRHLACKEAGVEARYELLPDEWSFERVKNRVVALNILRRHLSVGQRALVAAALANMSIGRNWGSNRANLPDNKSNKQAADMLGVGERTVKQAKAVKRDAPDLAEKVNNGEMSLNAADQERRKRLGMPTQTNAPKPKVVDLDQLIREQGDNFDGYVCAANIMTAARDLFLQEGEDGIEKNLMSAVRDSNKHKLSYNVAGLIALHDVLCKNIEELREISTPTVKTAYN